MGFARQLRMKNISSTNCVADGDAECVPKPLPCDAMYISHQQIMQICNGMVWRRNFLKTMDAQRQQANVKDIYGKQYTKNKHVYTHNRHQNAEYGKFKAKYLNHLQHIKKNLTSSLLEPVTDANILSAIMEKALKPFLYNLHTQSLQCEVNEKKRKRDASG